jgi:hypothetical protein
VSAHFEKEVVEGWRHLVTERMWLAVMVLPTTNCLVMSATCSVAAVLATSSA